MAITAVIVKRMGSKAVGAIAAALIVVAVVYFGFGVVGEASKKTANASAPSSAKGAAVKPVQAMNLALGNMVVLARELGFSITTADDTPFDGNKIVLRMEGHLQRLRDLYRQESDKNGALVGTMLLRFNIAPSGEVSQVSELSSRITDDNFKAAVRAEVAKWSFTDIVRENLTVTCPLLFVREGMDITTLVRWENSFAQGGAVVETSQRAESPSPMIAAKAEPAKTPPPKAAKPVAATAQLTTNESEIKYSTSLRRKPDFSSASLTAIAAGTKVTVLNKAGDWLEVRLGSAEPSGFVRKEFVKPLQTAGE
jgi:hypothetical protein